ncbi:glutamate synthase subunit beta [Lentilactobacillus kefiri]|uniref:NADPH-dependent glutamate synthase (Small subunit) n=2 Tax=Lentilactobacillus kefiri TaxID=33962 RepID=A0A8E1RI14_LENKE|nr:glutamate synthase subunit beta [Lentilactobacillus kefiri]KRL73667.1 NADPH-dependent glutamate synthase (small subunit) [Lentilactobacillus parakefiri DSM 10551]KRM49771.1 NADPH-dependent glutamate synthase (small subunit) [Lentilactobacillus kefiri DSM 20587 = JCM 5818]MCJ2161587.1 glutamate synthase subunit beta [Lentilactobacillus kefiri]MCP9368176.1 glutamate synthase subunit beta [Lentilactobacillus kefiri]MDH5108242.1 glutamate synthase subunit beta [Lentilactobacillus kefiri]
MADPKGFLKYNRKDNPMRPIMQRVKDFDAMELDLGDGDRREQAARCMNCGIPFCHHGVFYGGGRAVAGCPNDNLIPEWNDLVYQSRDQQAFNRLTKTNYLPDMTGRVCPAPCEAACVQALNGPGITIRNNEKFIIEQGFKYGWVVDSGKPAHRTGKKVAVVGSGPAGISVAWRLNQLGHSVTIFERDDRFGGLLMYGIPNMKLPKSIVERRIETLRQVGIKLVANTEVGKDISPEELRSQFDRIVICTGARKARDLNVEGRDLKGIYQAVDYLRLATQSVISNGVAANTILKGKHVLVLGGGDTGNDCIGTVIRQGCAGITQLEINPSLPKERAADNQWPEWPMVQKNGYGQKEARALFGNITSYSKTATAFYGSGGVVQEARISHVKNHQPISGGETTIKADLVLLAMGFTGAEQWLFDKFKITKKNKDYTTNDDQVFVAGDCRRGPSLVIWGIHEGRMCAEKVDASLSV